MEFFVSVKSTIDMLESRWLDELSRAADVDKLLPLTSFEVKEIANYRDQLDHFIGKNGPSVA